MPIVKFLFIDRYIDCFNSHATKKKSIVGNRPVEKAKKCYVRLIYKQFVQVSGLCGPEFLSHFPKRFTHLCRALNGDAILVSRFDAPIMAAGNHQKHLEFTCSIKALSFHPNTSIRVHKHIF